MPDSVRESCMPPGGRPPMVPKVAPDRPIAILVPVHGRHGKLDRALRSLVPEASLLKVVVIDDGSDPPIRIAPDVPLDVELIRLNSNRGIAAALNAGLAYVFERDFPYVARLDSDDVALEGRFRMQLDLLESDPAIGICGGGYHECDTDGRIVSTVRPPREDRAIRRAMHLRTSIWHPTVMIRTSVAREAGLFETSSKCEDIEYFQRILDRSRAANVPDPVIRYEVGAADALTGTAARRRAIAAALIGLKWRRREPLNPLWWLGMLSATCYLVGVHRALKPLRDLSMRLLDRGGG